MVQHKKNILLRELQQLGLNIYHLQAAPL